MVQLVIPMGGHGSRFAEAGYTEPKPFLPLFGKKMIEVVIENLIGPSATSIVLIAREDHRSRLEEISDNIREINGDGGHLRLEIFYLNEISLGPADSVRQAAKYLDNDQPVIVANSDQYVLGGVAELYSHLLGGHNEHALLVLEDSDPKWSFARIDELDYVTEVREKEPISRFATAGIYGFASGRSLLEGIEKMDKAGDLTNNELYVGPVYNYLLGGTKALYLGANLERFYGLGIPYDFELFKSKFDGGEL